MRKLKFRVWDTLQKEMTPLENLHVDGCFCWVFETTSMIVMQYTGLLDKQGVEIYEGDIVKYKEWTSFHDQCSTEIVEVEYLPERCKYTPMGWHVQVEDGFYNYEVEDIEVIGNIYQSPELLKTIRV